jgi:tetratricopeptide (TPR) repeat protein
LLELKDQRAAIPVLAHIIQVEDDNLSAHLDYATAILSVRENPQEAIASLRRVQELSPDHIQAQALLAEALAENNELTDALHAYQTVLETDLVEDPAWCSRISLGLGRTALALQQPDIAIAALQEASLADPQNPQIPCTLAEAYYAAGLLEDALQTARIGLGLALEDLDVLIWFAEKAIQWIGGNNKAKASFSTDTVSSELIAQVRTEALNTLTRAIQLAPQRTDLLIRLGRIQLLIEDTSAA